MKDLCKQNISAGQLRLQWWREMINDLYEGKIRTDHPICPYLNATIHAYSLNQLYFEKILEARV